MNESPEFPKVAAIPRVRHAKYKHHHRWPVAWRMWCRFVDFIYDVWPRN